MESITSYSTQEWVGLSTETKPIWVPTGTRFYEVDTGWSFTFNGYAWLPVHPLFSMSVVNFNEISLDQSAGDYDVMTATGQDLIIDAAIITVVDDLSDVSTFTGISVATDDGTPIEILSSSDGAKANLTGNFFHVFRGPAVTASTQKVQLTIGGGSAGSGITVGVTVFWRATADGGYYEND